MSYEGLNDKEKFEMVSIVNNNSNNVNVVSDSNSDNNIENDNDNFLMKTSATKTKQPPKSLPMQKWSMQ